MSGSIEKTTTLIAEKNQDLAGFQIMLEPSRVLERNLRKMEHEKCCIRKETKEGKQGEVSTEYP